MKKILSITALSLVVVLSSCSDFLNERPKGLLDQETFFSEEEGVLQGVNAIYIQLKSWDLIGFSWFGICEVPSDDTEPGSSPADGSWARINMFNDFTYDASTGEQNGWWSGQYKGIGYCNVVLDNIDKLKNEKLKVEAMAQAKFFRAFFYFNLVRTYGGVPLMVSIPSEKDYNRPRAKEEEIYKQIDEDLDFALKNLPTKAQWGTAELGRITRESAYGFKARVCLFRQDYVGAKAAALEVINSGAYNLHPDFRDLFNPNSLYCNEVMIADQYLWQADRNSESEFVKWQGMRGQGFGWGFMVPSQELVDAYNPKDPRKGHSIFFSGDSIEGFKKVVNTDPTVSNYANKKTIWPKSYWNTNSFGKTNVHLYFLRYADVLLMYAEACNETGDTNEALAKLELVRDRARNSATPAVSKTDMPVVTETDKARLRRIIWDERRYELALEGHRFFDIVRGEKVVPGYATEMIKTKGGKTNFDVTRHVKFLIPQVQIDRSQGAYEQNW